MVFNNTLCCSFSKTLIGVPDAFSLVVQHGHLPGRTYATSPAMPDLSLLSVLHMYPCESCFPPGSPPDMPGLVIGSAGIRHPLPFRCRIGTGSYRMRLFLRFEPQRHCRYFPVPVSVRSHPHIAGIVRSAFGCHGNLSGFRFRFHSPFISPGSPYLLERSRIL